jgi:predicted GNAT family N-acyltransferase
LTSKFKSEPLDRKKHNRAAFSCEHKALTDYIKHQASQDVKKNVAAVFVLTPDGVTISGYYILSQYGVDASEIPQALLEQLKIPKYPRLPATLIGRLARHIDFKGQSVGEDLLMDALRRALNATRTIASVAVVVEAKDEKAVRFNERYGFIAMPDHADRLFIPMATVSQLFERNDEPEYVAALREILISAR